MFLDDNPCLLKRNEIRGELCWTKRLTAENFQIPLYIALESGNYLITDFESASYFAVKSKETSFYGGFKAGINAYGVSTITLEEWAALYKVAVSISVDILPLLPNSSRAEILPFLAALPPYFLKYLSEKRISFHTCFLIFLMKERGIGIIEYALLHKLTSQSFKKLVEKERDGHAKERSHKALDELVKSIKLNITPKDNYESASLKLSFSVSNDIEYNNAVLSLNAAKDDILRYFEQYKKVME